MVIRNAFADGRVGAEGVIDIVCDIGGRCGEVDMP